MKRFVIALLVAASCVVCTPALSLAVDANIAGEQAVISVNINEASPEELQQLPGVGKAISQRIVDYREQVGPFRQPDDLEKVKGIGSKTMSRIRSMVVVE